MIKIMSLSLISDACFLVQPGCVPNCTILFFMIHIKKKKLTICLLFLLIGNCIISDNNTILSLLLTIIIF